MALYGIIDLGSNSIRLVVYETAVGARTTGSAAPASPTCTSASVAPASPTRTSASAAPTSPTRTSASATFTSPSPKKAFRSLINEKKIVGLSAYVKDSVFTQAGIDRAAEVLDDHLRHARNVGCTDVSIFATAVLRNCTNSKAATRAISTLADAPIEVLSARDEAHLGFVGATCNRTIENGTLIDIGGGSTELTRVRGGVDSDSTSLPQGSVSSYARFVGTVLPTREEILAIEQAFLDQLSTLESLEPYRARSLYGVGGATRAAAKMYGAAFSNGTRPKTLQRRHLEELLDLLERDPHTFAHLAAKATPERLHTLVPGCVITATLMRELGSESLEICRYGVREGYLIERILNM